MFGPLWIYDGNRWETFHKQAAKIPYQHTSKRNNRFHDEMVSHTEYLVRLSEAEQHLRPRKRCKQAPMLDLESRACIFHGDCVKWNCVVSFEMAQQVYGSDIIASDTEHKTLRDKVAAFAHQRGGCAPMGARNVLLYKSLTLLAATEGHEAVHLRAAHAFNDVSMYSAVYTVECIFDSPKCDLLIGHTVAGFSIVEGRQS